MADGGEEVAVGGGSAVFGRQDPPRLEFLVCEESRSASLHELTACLSRAHGAGTHAEHVSPASVDVILNGQLLRAWRGRGDEDPAAAMQQWFNYGLNPDSFTEWIAWQLEMRGKAAAAAAAGARGRRGGLGPQPPPPPPSPPP